MKKIAAFALTLLTLPVSAVAWASGASDDEEGVCFEDRNFDWGRSSIRRDHRPREHRLAGGGVPADAFVRLEGRGNGGHRGGSEAGADPSVVPVGRPPTPKVPAS